MKLCQDFKGLFKVFVLFCFVFFCQAKQHYEIVVLGPGNEPVSPALDAWSLSLYKVRNAALFSSFIQQVFIIQHMWAAEDTWAAEGLPLPPAHVPV